MIEKVDERALWKRRGEDEEREIKQREKSIAGKGGYAKTFVDKKQACFDLQLEDRDGKSRCVLSLYTPLVPRHYISIVILFTVHSEGEDHRYYET